VDFEEDIHNYSLRILSLKTKGCCYLLEAEIVFHRKCAHHGEGNTQNVREMIKIKIDRRERHLIGDTLGSIIPV